MLINLKIKIIAVVLGTLLVVFAAVLLAVNISVNQTSVKRAEVFMLNIIENEGFRFQPADKNNPPPNDKNNKFNNHETMRTGRYFYAKLDKDGKIFNLNLEMMFDFRGTDAEKYIETALKLERIKGEIDNYTFRISEKEYGSMIVFAERSIEISLLEQLTKISLWAAGIAGFVLICLAAFLAEWITTPVKNAFNKQRRFISDASHELKTPLTIIGANVDVLRNEIGENMRLSHIKSQSERMNGLVHDLLTLAKTDENKSRIVMCEFNLSNTVLNASLEFESLAYEEGKKYSCNIDGGINYTGDEKQIKQLINILIDNAVRYSDKNGQISVSLSEESGKPKISVYNTGMGVPNDERDKIFERFYRRDESRSRETGGFGIGLSVAKNIVNLHKGKIHVAGEYEKWIRFDAVL